MGGLGHGLASLVGLGEAYDPLQDLRSKLADVNQQLQNTVNNGALIGLETADEALRDLFQMIQMGETTMNRIIQYNTLLLTDDIAKENVFTSVLGATVVIIVFFMLWQKKCC